jgi:hypothetical protein
MPPLTWKGPWNRRGGMDEFVQKIIDGSREIERKRAEIGRVVNTVAGLLPRCVDRKLLLREVVDLYDGMSEPDTNGGWWSIWIKYGKDIRKGYRLSGSQLIFDDRGDVQLEHIDLVHQSLGHLVEKLRKKYPKLDDHLKPFVDAAEIRV